MNLRRIIIFLVAMAIYAFLSAQMNAQAAIYYVATNGNNSNPGTIDQPWLTIQWAVDHVIAGDTINVRAGTYVGARIENSGIQGKPITLRSFSGELVLLNSAGPNNKHNSIMEVETWNGSGIVSYWIIDGFEIANAGRYGVDLRSTYYVTAKNNTVHNSAVTGIFSAFSYFARIENNESYSNGEHGIYYSNSGDYPTIKRNRSHNNYGCGIHMNGDASMGGDGIISGAVVERNIIYDNGTGGGSGINMDGVTDSIIRNNLIYNMHASGISLYNTDGAVCSSNNWVINNTVITAADGRWALNIPGADCTGNHIYNNIFYTFHSWRGSISLGSAAQTGFVSNHNIVMDRFSVDDGSTRITLSQWQVYGYDANSVIAAPAQLFVDYANNNYHLKSGSPAINAGQSIPDVPLDLDGYIRPKGTALDASAYEYGAVFQDVSGDYWASYWIELLYKANVTQGCSSSPLLYCPENSITRDQMAVFLGRAIHGTTYNPPPATGIFADVPANYWAAAWIEQIYNDGVTGGCSTNPLRYCPLTGMTRDQMAKFMVKSMHGSSYVPPAPAGIFADVGTGYWAASWIEQLFKDGITDGCSMVPLLYCPTASLNRAQMAKFLTLAFVTGVPRPFPITKNGIYIFNDQLTNLSSLTTPQIQFAVTHYAGTQKMTRADANILRNLNPYFVILHYRLGQALGHSMPDASCNPTTNYLQIINTTWVQEWPGDSNVLEEWFYHYSSSRVFSCSWGHYLAELDNINWRHWWTDQVITQLNNNADDGIFADSYSPANYLGPYNPPLPGYDLELEQAWANREHSFTDYIKERFNHRYFWIPNIGSCVTTRDPSDYTNIDGAMIEGFGYEIAQSYGETDWQLQMNRMLTLIILNKPILTQSYVDPANITDRMFNLASYLLIKGLHTFINFEIGEDPEWFPEYSIDLGPYTTQVPASITDLYNSSWQVYQRNYQNGMVLVNPSNASRAITLPGTYLNAVPQGGGFIPADGQIPASWIVNYTSVTSITLPPSPPPS